MASKKEVKSTMTGLELKYEVLLVYLVSILGFIFSFIKNPNVSEDARFHYKQSGATFIVYTGLAIVESIFASIATAMMFTPAFGLSVVLWILIVMISLLEVAVVVFAVITIVKAFNNQKYEIPVISKLANAIWK